MSMKPNNRKNQRTTATRQSRGRNITPEGVYSNHPYMHAATSQVGNIVYVQTQSGAVYEGIFRTFSSNFHVALEVAHKVDLPLNGEEPKIAIETVCNTFIFKLEDIVSICAKNVDLDYATRDTFQTDTAISKCNGNSRSEDRELEPWDPAGSGLTNGDYDLSLQLENDSHGWDANEMFQKNESIYGVQSTFDQSLAGYTVPIEKKNTKDYREIEIAAEKIANEIENNPAYLERVDLENNDELDDEEAKFSAVLRDASSSSPLPQRQERQQAQHHQESRQSEQRSESAQTSNNNNSRETHNSRDSRGETRENSRSQEVRENHIDKGAQSSVSPPTIQNQQQVNQNQLQQPPQQQQVIPQVSAQQERISNQGSQERTREIHHHHQQQQHQNQHNSGGNSNNQSMPNQSMHSIAQQNMNTNNTNNVPQAKYLPQPKNRNPKMNNKLVRSTPPPPNNNSASGPPTPQSPQAPQVQNHPQQQQGKQNNYMIQQQNMGPAPQYIHGTQLAYTQQVHNQATAGKLNGQDQNTNQGQNNKMGQRSFPRYPQNANVNAPPPQNVGPQMKNIQQQQPQIQMGKTLHHVTHIPQQTVVDGQPCTHVVVPHPIIVQQPILQAPAGIPTQNQMPRPPRSRDDTTQDFRKFHNNFKLDNSSHPQDNRNQQQQQQQQQQQAPPPSQGQQIVQQNDNTQIQGHQQQAQQSKPQREPRQQQQQQQQQSTQIANDSSHQMQMQGQNQQQAQATNVPQHQQGPPQSSNNSINNNNNNNASDADKAGGSSTPGTKKFVLNPAAKPFTPRTPATPSATRPQNSRPHTPQTPSSAIPAQVMAYAPPHTPGPPIVAASPNQPMMTIPTAYVVQPPAYQQPPRQAKRIPASAAQIQVAAATGAPLLAPGPQFVYQPQPPFPGAPAYTFRMPPFESSGQPQIQYLTATPPSTTPSPGQAQQFHPGPQPSPASQAATYMPMQQQGPHVSFPMITANGHQIVHQFYQPTAGPQPQQQYIIMHQQHPSTQ